MQTSTCDEAHQSGRGFTGTAGRAIELFVSKSTAVGAPPPVRRHLLSARIIRLITASLILGSRGDFSSAVPPSCSAAVNFFAAFFHLPLVRCPRASTSSLKRIVRLSVTSCPGRHASYAAFYAEVCSALFLRLLGEGGESA